MLLCGDIIYVKSTQSRQQLIMLPILVLAIISTELHWTFYSRENGNIIIAKASLFSIQNLQYKNVTTFCF
jgi:hypothetical protein